MYISEIHEDYILYVVMTLMTSDIIIATPFAAHPLTVPLLELRLFLVAIPVMINSLNNTSYVQLLLILATV